MPRDYGLIQTNIWAEPTVTSLTPEEQRAYLLVYTQPDLNRCGVLPYTLRRWAGLAKGDSAKRLRAAFRTLEDRRLLVIDESTEELLVRTYIRWDGLLAQPQVVGAMVRDFRTIRSATLTTAVLTELRRIWHLPVKDTERRGLRIAFGVVENDKQREAVGEGLARPMTRAIEQGLVEPFERGSVQGLPEGLGKALARRPGPGPGPGPDACPGPDSATRPSDEVAARSWEVDPTTEPAWEAS
jgi:hypothetical protein